MAGGINRIRLEFKPVQTLKHSAQRRVLIESDWNLKPEEPPDPLMFVMVLIESDWNLKLTVILTVLPDASVLIESGWNLKRFKLILRNAQNQY